MTEPESSHAHSFVLDERLLEGSRHVASWPLCDVLLKNERRYLWVVLVPRRANVREIYELAPEDRAQLLHESCALGAALVRMSGADKLNVAAIGNVVPQLHVHHVARFRSDPTWPAPFFGAEPAEPWDAVEFENWATRLRAIEV